MGEERPTGSTRYMMEPALFLAAPPKCGGTYVTRILSQHPDLDFARESYIINPGFHDSITTPGSRKVKWHGVTDDDAARWRDMVLGENIAGARRAIGELTAHLSKVTGAKFVGESWPFWAANARVARAMFPDAKWLYVTRDPRAVYASPDHGNNSGRDGWERLYNIIGSDKAMNEALEGSARLGVRVVDGCLNMDVFIPKGGISRRDAKQIVRISECLAGSKPSEDIAEEQFELLMHNGESDEDRLRWMTVQYEAAVMGRKEVCRAIWQWLGLDPDRGWWKYDADKDPLPLRWSHVRNSVDRPDPSRCTAWEGVLSDEEKREVTRHSQKYCREWGYSLEVAGPLAGDRLERFLQGESAAVVGEDFVREEITKMKRIVREAATGCDAIMRLLEQDVGEGVAHLHQSEFRRGFACGEAAGKIKGSTAIVNLRNRLIMIMAGDHEGLDNDEVRQAAQEHGSDTPPKADREHCAEPQPSP